jgi:hypothetical protein
MGDRVGSNARGSSRRCEPGVSLDASQPSASLTLREACRDGAVSAAVRWVGWVRLVTIKPHSRLAAMLPGVGQLVCYQREWLVGDVLAGLTVAAYLVPCMRFWVPRGSCPWDLSPRPH